MKSFQYWCCVFAVSMLVVTASDAEPRLTLKNVIRDRMYRPTRVAAQRTGTLAVADFQRKQIYLFNAGTRFVSSFRVPSPPLSIAYAADGTLYVGIANDVLRMTIQGTILDRFSNHGTAPLSPVDLAVGANALVYVVDKENHRVSVYSGNGVFQFSFGSLGSIWQQNRTQITRWQIMRRLSPTTNS